MANEEVLMQLSMFEQQAQEVKQQIEAVDAQIIDLENLKLSLARLGNKKDKEMLAPLGRGIFIKTDIKEDKVFINVGSKVLVKKTFSEGIEIIDQQIVEMNRIRNQLVSSIEEINNNLNQIVEQAQKSE